MEAWHAIIFRMKLHQYKIAFKKKKFFSFFFFFGFYIIFAFLTETILTSHGLKLCFFLFCSRLDIYENPLY